MQLSEDPSLLVLSTSEMVLVDTDLLPELSQFNWYPTGEHGYAARTLGKRGNFESLHRRINQTPRGLKTDHINGYTWDNRRSNLRTATHNQNIQNSRKYQGKFTSKFKGVSFRKDRGTWLASIRVGKSPNRKIGTFKTEIEAAKAYDKAALQFFGEFARLNFPL